ncbi:MAG: ribosome assembly factor SBDS [Acidilobaceae archaeon]
MSKKQSFVIAWMEVRGERFEILVKPELAFRFREGEKVDVNEILWTDTVFKDSRKGLKASPESLRKAFGTEDVRAIAERILKEGMIQLTEEERRRLIEAKRKKIVAFIARNAIDPRSKLPIPESRIESLMEELGIGVDLYRDVESQALEIVSKLSKAIPIKIAKALLEVEVPPDVASRVASEAKRLGQVKKLEWLSSGGVKLELEIPAGMQLEVINKIQSIAKGKASVNVKVVA